MDPVSLTLKAFQLLNGHKRWDLKSPFTSWLLFQMKTLNVFHLLVFNGVICLFSLSNNGPDWILFFPPETFLCSPGGLYPYARWRSDLQEQETGELVLLTELCHLRHRGGCLVKNKPRVVIFWLSFTIYHNMRRIIGIKMSCLLQLGSGVSLAIEKQKKTPKNHLFYFERKEARPYLRGESLPKFNHVESWLKLSDMDLSVQMD